MNAGASHNRAKYTCVCKYCGKEFDSKRKNKIICYKMKCVRQYEREASVARNKRRKDKKRQDTIKNLEHCIKHEQLYYTGKSPNQDKIDEWRTQLEIERLKAKDD